jgi:hypothetical protein
MMVLNMVVGSLLAALAHYLFQVRPWRVLNPEPIAPHCTLPRFPTLIYIACSHITYHLQTLNTHSAMSSAGGSATSCPRCCW